MKVQVKICGLTDRDAVQAAVQAGASYVGFVFYPSSPRSLTVEAAQRLAEKIPAHVMKTGLFVDADDATLASIAADVRLDLIQLHGKETPARAAEIREKLGLPVMKAIGIAGGADFAQVPAYEAVADMILFDAKPPPEATRPGGNAESFDWSLLQGRSFTRPWMLAGGLNIDNLTAAVKGSGAHIVDVSSGVEDRPGHKDAEKIRAFIELAKRL